MTPETEFRSEFIYIFGPNDVIVQPSTIASLPEFTHTHRAKSGSLRGKLWEQPRNYRSAKIYLCITVAEIEMCEVCGFESKTNLRPAGECTNYDSHSQYISGPFYTADFALLCTGQRFSLCTRHHIFPIAFTMYVHTNHNSSMYVVLSIYQLCYSM